MGVFWCSDCNVEDKGSTISNSSSSRSEESVNFKECREMSSAPSAGGLGPLTSQ